MDILLATSELNDVLSDAILLRKLHMITIIKQHASFGCMWVNSKLWQKVF